MKNKKIVKKYTFSQEERDQLRNIQVGIVCANATMTGLQVYKNAFLGQVYKRLGIDGDPQKGNSKSIQYNLSLNEIVYTEEPIIETQKPVEAKEAKK